MACINPGHGGRAISLPGEGRGPLRLPAACGPRPQHSLAQDVRGTSELPQQSGAALALVP